LHLFLRWSTEARGCSRASPVKRRNYNKDAAMSFLQDAPAMTDAVAAREVIEPDKSQDGFQTYGWNSGMPECLNVVQTIPSHKHPAFGLMKASRSLRSSPPESFLPAP
jgi:hypothetical protein